MINMEDALNCIISIYETLFLPLVEEQGSINNIIHAQEILRAMKNLQKEL